MILNKFKLLVLILISYGSFGLSETIRFPKDFKWCVATAAHQIEGYNYNSDHYNWEINQANRVISQRIVSNPLAVDILKNSSGAFVNVPISCPIIQKSEDPDFGRDHTILFPIALPDAPSSASNFQNQICEYSGRAVDHWNRVSEDAQLIKNLNVQWYRFSVEWAKIEPRKGKFSPSALKHYIDEIKNLQKLGIEPHLTLFHFTMPQWLRNEGGWESSQSPEYFRLFTKKIYSELAKQGVFIPVWYTFNEPMVHISAGYLAGVLPPGLKNPLKLPNVLQNILKAHALSYRELHFLAASTKYRQGNLRVGIAHHLRVFEPLEDLGSEKKKIAETLTQFIDYAWNWMFIDAIETGVLSLNTQPLKASNLDTAALLEDFEIVNKTLKGTQDFLGLNYYSRDRVSIAIDPKNPIAMLVDPEAKLNGRVTDMNWEIYPEGLYKMVKSLHRRVLDRGGRILPIIISENGIADSQDSKRISFLKEHLRYLSQAIDEGIPIEGYCYWSLLDNFEWNSGYFPQFGLYSVDFKNNLKRTPRNSAFFFSEMAKTNQFEY